MFKKTCTTCLGQKVTKRKVSCDNCHGSGRRGNTCSKCHGSKMMDVEEICSTCGGTGKISW